MRTQCTDRVHAIVVIQKKAGLLLGSNLVYSGCEFSLQLDSQSITTTGALPAIKSEATAICAPQDGRWKITVSFDGRRFCVPKFRH